MATKTNIITVQDVNITISYINENDYISLTDMVAN